jgi:hypothetical protein
MRDGLRVSAVCSWVHGMGGSGGEEGDDELIGIWTA